MAEVAETHVNAYKVELAEAEQELVRAQDRVDTLKQAIAEREERDGTPAETPADEPTSVPADEDKPVALRDLKKDELKAVAKEEGVRVTKLMTAKQIRTAITKKRKADQ